ncbi:MAG: peptide-methionine (S)-S-oxide reductase MsrA [Proteobacteria bacterium]|nr:peptide-methionine (S)-S-oxide reductase MsrA [Pseudomonadota bacterium]MDE3208518.1 peptide-methionine (S)-S-oxide reductase MsrA [Pseudomonadota bacterium]
MEKIVFGAGCFWGVEAAFRQVGGVMTRVGYMGGDLEHPTYRDVCRGDTGHVEVVEISYDPLKVGLDQLLAVFWNTHDPTTPNRQGPDIGTQYRSVIFCATPEQLKLAQASMVARQSVIPQKIITEITLMKVFWMAEDYHQQYLEKRGLSYCH